MGRWIAKIDVSEIFKHYNTLEEEEKELRFDITRKEIVTKIQQHYTLLEEIFDNLTTLSELVSIVDTLLRAEDRSEFNEVWDSLYDWCDYNRVWLATF